MKRIFFVFSIGMLFLTYSCKKEITPVADNNSTSASLEIDYSKINKTSGKANSMLIFESWEHFNNVKNTLVTQCVTHTNNYISPLAEQGLVDDNLTAKIESDGFNAFLPVHTFAQTMGFQSYYQVAETAEKIYMDQNVEQLDPAGDPFKNVERYESALLNTDGEVMIGNEVVNLTSVFTNKNTSCSQNGNNTKSIQYWYTSSLGKRFREMKGNIGPRPFQSISSTTMKYRKLSGNWAYWFTNPYATVEGFTLLGTFENGCNDEKHTVNYKQSSIPWGFYVYNYSWHGKSPSWNIMNTNQIQSKHAAPGYTLSHGY